VSSLLRSSQLSFWLANLFTQGILLEKVQVINVFLAYIHSCIIIILSIAYHYVRICICNFKTDGWLADAAHTERKKEMW